MNEEFKPVVINGQRIPLCTVEYLDDEQKKGNVGHYFVFVQYPPAEWVEHASKFSGFVSLFMGHFKGKQLSSSLEAAVQIGSIVHQEAHDGCLIAFPRRKDESQQDAITRMVNAQKVISVDGKVLEPLPQNYATPAKYKEDWKTVLNGAPFLRMAALYSDLPISTPQALTFTELFLAEVAPRSRNILYKKADGKLMVMPLSKLEEKIARSRGIEKFTFTNNILIPQIIADFLKRDTQKGSGVNPDYPEQRFLGWEHDLVVGCQRDANDRQQLTNTNIEKMSELCDRIEVRKIPGIDGFGVFAISDFPAGVFVGQYAGRFCDYMYPLEEALNHSYKTAEEDGVVWSNNQAIYSFREGNLTGLINHAPIQKHKDHPGMQNANVLHKVCTYNGLPVPCYVTLRPIKKGEQLLTCVPTIFEDQPELFFNDKGGVIENDVSRKLAGELNKKGVSFFKGEKNLEAKRKFKQAVALSSEPGCRYNLGSVYLKLGKYAKARFFLEQVSRNKSYTERANTKLALIPKGK
ncbi:MAG: hypothetical protein SFW07_03210 [Gammaproteobacteria bacterium]|nr:hypothetical protein [Gammaproteobacteria bacterium]